MAGNGEDDRDDDRWHKEGIMAQPTGAVTPAQIAAWARQRGLDPQAVLAVARTEGLGGGIGDGGHAFGPFQLNDAGGVITGKFPGQSQDQVQQWAWSPSGVNYALAGIQKVAGGLQGAPAINAIVHGFERPADQPSEISKALSYYGGGAPSSSPVPLAAGAAPSVPSATGPVQAAPAPAALPQGAPAPAARPAGPRPLPAAVQQALAILRS